MKTYYYNNECGNIFPRNAKGFLSMIEEAKILYDFDDTVNFSMIWEYYSIITLNE